MNNNIGQPPPRGDGQAHLIPDSPNNEEGVAEHDDDDRSSLNMRMILM